VRFDASLTFLFPDAPLPGSFARARLAGFEAVELQDLAGIEPAMLADAARAAGVAVVLINAPCGDLAEGGPGLSGVPGRESQFRGAIAYAADAASTLDCARVHVGPCRLGAGVARDDALATLEDNLRWAGDHLGARGIEALVEAINPHDAPGVLLDHVETALGVVERVGHPSVRLSFDAYHVARCDEDPAAWVRRCAPAIGHVQVADCPGRGAPGTGRIDFAALLAALAGIGYRGWIGAEYRPAEPAQATLEWLLRSASADGASDATRLRI
jgi:hydroxypyruvate isomerase